MRTSKILLSNTDRIEGHEIVETLGLVWGTTTRARHLGRDITAAIRNIFGGEIKEYTNLLDESRKIALDRMVEKARSMGADAVVNIRFSTSMIMQGVAEIVAYGTAVEIRS